MGLVGCNTTKEQVQLKPSWTHPVHGDVVWEYEPLQAEEKRCVEQLPARQYQFTQPSKGSKLASTLINSAVNSAVYGANAAGSQSVVTAGQLDGVEEHNNKVVAEIGRHSDLRMACLKKAGWTPLPRR